MKYAYVGLWGPGEIIAENYREIFFMYIRLTV
jgi:hypothetical protein